VMFETFLLRVYYLNDLDDVDCETCLFIPMQSRDSDKMLQFKVQCSDTLWRCMIAMMVQHENGGLHARSRMIFVMMHDFCWENCIQK
jgi:hypothetical protein